MTRAVVCASVVAAAALLAPYLPSFFVSSENHDEKYVSCGSAVKLTHVDSGGKYFLNSGGQSLGSGSGQQIITLIPNNGKHTSLLLIREGDDKPACTPGEPIECGQQVRLTHLQTDKNLHTHLIRSPLSRQQEVTGFGENGEGDRGDNWTIVCGSGAKLLRRDTTFRLQHSDTKRYLSATDKMKFTEQNCGGNCPILHHLEVAGRSSPDKNTEFKIDLGIHLSND